MMFVNVSRLMWTLPKTGHPWSIVLYCIYYLQLPLFYGLPFLIVGRLDFVVSHNNNEVSLISVHMLVLSMRVCGALCDSH